MRPKREQAATMRLTETARAFRNEMPETGLLVVEGARGA
jgi:hypothetical protein